MYLIFLLRTTGTTRMQTTPGVASSRQQSPGVASSARSRLQSPAVVRMKRCCYEPDSLWPAPHEPLNTNPLIESLAECARADAIVHGWCSQCVHAEIRLFTKYGHQHEQN